MLLADILRPAEVYEVDLTPALARDLLDRYNRSNRRLLPARAGVLREEMINDRWDHRANVVAFRNDALLLGDGQHRLEAIAQLPEDVRVRVTMRFDWDEESVAACDQVKARTAQDIAAVLGLTEPGSDTALAAVRLAITMERTDAARSAIPRPWVVQRYRETPYAVECGQLGKLVGAQFPGKLTAAVAAYVLLGVVRHHGLAKARLFTTDAQKRPRLPVFEKLMAFDGDPARTAHHYRQAELLARAFDMWLVNPRRSSGSLECSGELPQWVRA